MNGLSKEQEARYAERAREIVGVGELDLPGIEAIEILPGPVDVRPDPDGNGAWVSIWMLVPEPEEG